MLTDPHWKVKVMATRPCAGKGHIRPGQGAFAIYFITYMYEKKLCCTQLNIVLAFVMWEKSYITKART